MEEELGKRIKQLRKEKGLILRELAERSKLSIGYISLVERGLTSISLTSLKNIAVALEVSYNDFFMMNPPLPAQDRVVRGYDLRVFQLNNSNNIYHSLRGNIPAGEQRMEPILVTLLPGQEEKNVLPYSHDGEEFGYVLEGVLTFLFENKRRELNPGDSLHIPSQTPHNWANFTNKLVRLLYINTTKVF